MLNYYAGIGSRETPPDVCAQMSMLASELWLMDFVLRSGKAPGADQAFGRGARYLAEVWKPWDSFEGYDEYDLVPPTLDVVGALDEDGLVPPADPWTRKMWLLAMKNHPGWNSLSQGAQKLMVRNGFQIFGDGPDAPPVKFVAYWAPVDSKGRPKGGTSQAVRIATAALIPCFNLLDTPIEKVLSYARSLRS